MQQYLIKITPELAEFVGIMLGDGHIAYPKQPRLKVSFDSRDKQYFIFVKDLLIKLFNVRVVERHSKTTNASDLLFFKRDLIRYVINELGLLPSPKWGRMRVPNWIFEYKLENHFLRGLLDTDGCVTITDNNGTIYPRIEVKVAPSPALQQIRQILVDKGYHFGFYALPRGNVRIQLNGKKQLKKWMEEIGFSNKKHFDKAMRFI